MPPIVEEPVQPDETVQLPSLAPWQHTLFLLGVLALWAAYGALHARLPTSAIPLTIRYISSIVMQSLLVGSTLAGVYHRREFLNRVFGRPSARQLTKDFLQGGLIFIVGLVLLVAVRFVLKFTVLHGTYRRDVVRGMLPQSNLELAFWIIVAIAAGTSEEFIFRGYLQRQLSAWFRNVPVAIAICAILFGCMHFYQGFEGAIATGALGALYGVCAWRVSSLRGVMIAHSLQDITAGLIHYFRNS
jgi:membrane protease YdiL (CAAX protease family)